MRCFGEQGTRTLGRLSNRVPSTTRTFSSSCSRWCTCFTTRSTCDSGLPCQPPTTHKHGQYSLEIGVFHLNSCAAAPNTVSRFWYYSRVKTAAPTVPVLATRHLPMASAHICFCPACNVHCSLSKVDQWHAWHEGGVALLEKTLRDAANKARREAEVTDDADDSVEVRATPSWFHHMTSVRAAHDDAPLTQGVPHAKLRFACVRRSFLRAATSWSNSEACAHMCLFV